MQSSRSREALRELLKRDGILQASQDQPIRHRDGALAPWAFYSWQVTLTSEGLRLAAQCLLERLASFRGTQLATVGYTGMPLLSACVLLGEGRYTGLCIRETRKAYLSCRRIEGTLDRRSPVIIVDDSISSGTSLERAIRAVEDEGAEVEGSVALVNFPLRGGIEWANAKGYRAEALFDIWDDLDMARTLAPAPRDWRFAHAPEQAPDGLHPAALARHVARFYLRHGQAPTPPRRMDRDYDGRGGVFVSFRRRDTDHRIARDGFWHFAAADGEPCRDVVAATVETIQSAAGRIAAENLEDLKIAVTFFTALERVPPSKLDFDCYGIVVRSRFFPHKLGGALPNTQVFISEIEQYHHAREVNAQVQRYEPHDLFRHRLVKCVEPGERWLPYGVAEDDETAWWRDTALGGRLLARARALVVAALRGEPPAGEPIPNDCLPCAASGIAVRLYRAGLVGYGLCLGGDLDTGLIAAAREAVDDRRYAGQRGGGLDVRIVVSVLHHPESLGSETVVFAARKLRRGLDALGVAWRGRTIVLLPSALTYNNWSRQQFVEALLSIAGASGSHHDWTTWQVAEWTGAAEKILPLRFGFPDHRADEPDPRHLVRSLASYVHRWLGADRLPGYYRAPSTGDAVEGGTAARAIHAMMALDLAGEILDEAPWRAAARAGYAYCLQHIRAGVLDLPGRAGGALADCVLLAGLAQNPTFVAAPQAFDIAQRLRRMIRSDGRIGDFAKRLDLSDDQEFLPGAVLWALGHYQKASGFAVLPECLEPALAFYQRRFRAVPGWGMAGWQPQGWCAVHQTRGDPAFAAFAFEAIDWVLERQLEKNGAFLEDLSPDEPSFNTGFIAEGVASAWMLAVGCGDDPRAQRYAAAWRSAMRFMTRLIILPEDTFSMRDGAAAVGGVRATISRSDVRIDQVSHCLHALVLGVRNASAAGLPSSFA